MRFVFEEARGDGLFSVPAYQRQNLCVWALKNVLNIFVFFLEGGR